MKTVAYVRVSTDTQDVTHQRLAILEFARTERMAVDAFQRCRHPHGARARCANSMFYSRAWNPGMPSL